MIYLYVQYFIIFLYYEGAPKFGGGGRELLSRAPEVTINVSVKVQGLAVIYF
jgi:hypothetical protein